MDSINLHLKKLKVKSFFRGYFIGFIAVALLATGLLTNALMGNGSAIVCCSYLVPIAIIVLAMATNKPYCIFPIIEKHYKEIAAISVFTLIIAYATFDDAYRFLPFLTSFAIGYITYEARQKSVGLIGLGAVCAVAIIAAGNHKSHAGFCVITTLLICFVFVAVAYLENGEKKANTKWTKDLLEVILVFFLVEALILVVAKSDVLLSTGWQAKLNAIRLSTISNMSDCVVGGNFIMAAVRIGRPLYFIFASLSLLLITFSFIHSIKKHGCWRYLSLSIALSYSVPLALSFFYNLHAPIPFISSDMVMNTLSALMLYLTHFMPQLESPLSALSAAHTDNCDKFETCNDSCELTVTGIRVNSKSLIPHLMEITKNYTFDKTGRFSVILSRSTSTQIIRLTGKKKSVVEEIRAISLNNQMAMHCFVTYDNCNFVDIKKMASAATEPIVVQHANFCGYSGSSLADFISDISDNDKIEDDTNEEISAIMILSYTSDEDAAIF